MSGELSRPELIDDEGFLANLDEVNPTDYQRQSEKSPADLLFEWMKAANERWQPKAKNIKNQYLELVGPDAEYYKVTPEELFELHLEAMNKLHEDFNIDEYK